MRVLHLAAAFAFALCIGACGKTSADASRATAPVASTSSNPAPPVSVVSPPGSASSAPLPRRLETVWPLKVCAGAKAAGEVDPAIVVQTCNCGETVSCEMRFGASGAELEVRQDPATMKLCTACSSSEGRCSMSRRLPAGQAAVHVNTILSVVVDTDSNGAPAANRCWDVPRPPTPTPPASASSSSPQRGAPPRITRACFRGSALIVENECGCNDALVCGPVRATSRVIDLAVRLDPNRLRHCTDCFPMVPATCTLPALAPGAWDVRVNGRRAFALSVASDDDRPTEGTCWSVAE